MTGKGPETGSRTVPVAGAAGLTALYVQHRAEILRFLRARTRDPAEADDVSQELWIKLQARVGPVGNGRAYLFQMANNLVLDRARARRRRTLRDATWTEEALDGFAAGDAAIAPEPRPDESLLQAEELRQLTAAMQQLPAAARRALSLHRIDGLSHVEVAAKLGISRSGVEKHIAVAMKHLRRVLLD